MSVQPRARTISASSAPTASKNASRAWSGSIFQAVWEDDVAEVQVAVAPRARAAPRRRFERLVPGGEQPGRVVAVVELRRARAHPAVDLAQSALPQAGRSVRRIHRAQREDQLGKVACRLRRNAVDHDVLALQPGEDAPWERKALRRIAAAERRRNRERERTREDGQPLELALQPRDFFLLARQPHELVGAEPVVRVVGAEREDRLDRQLRPFGELPGDEALHEERVGLDLVRVHPHARLNRRRRPRSAGGRERPRPRRSAVPSRVARRAAPPRALRRRAA